MLIALILAALAIVVILLGEIVWTVGATKSAWSLFAAAAAIASGGVIGLSCGLEVEWQPSETIIYIGFPIPGMLLHWENGEWIDFVGPQIVVAPFLDALIFAAAFLFPQFLVLLVKRIRTRSAVIRWPTAAG